jgi:hypothetical protein
LVDPVVASMQFVPLVFVADRDADHHRTVYYYVFVSLLLLQLIFPEFVLDQLLLLQQLYELVLFFLPPIDSFVFLQQRQFLGAIPFSSALLAKLEIVLSS